MNEKSFTRADWRLSNGVFVSARVYYLTVKEKSLVDLRSDSGLYLKPRKSFAALCRLMMWYIMAPICVSHGELLNNSNSDRFRDVWRRSERSARCTNNEKCRKPTGTVEKGKTRLNLLQRGWTSVLFENEITFVIIVIIQSTRWLFIYIYIWIIYYLYCLHGENFSRAFGDVVPMIIWTDINITDKRFTRIPEIPSKQKPFDDIDSKRRTQETRHVYLYPV